MSPAPSTPTPDLEALIALGETFTARADDAGRFSRAALPLLRELAERREAMDRAHTLLVNGSLGVPADSEAASWLHGTISNALDALTATPTPEARTPQ